MLHGERNEKGKNNNNNNNNKTKQNKTIALKQKKNISACSTRFFLHFLQLFSTTTTWKFLY